MFKKSLIAVTAVFLAILMVPTIKASAENAVSGSAIVTESLATTGSSITLKKARKVRKSGYRPVNAKKLTASYKKKLRKQKKNWIGVSYGNYKSRVKAEQKSLIDISWEELKANSQVKITKKAFDLMCRVVQCEAGDVRYTTKEMTAEVIVNRARSYKGSSDPVYKALTAKHQFSVVRMSRIHTNDINGETVNACKDALLKNSHPKNLKFFRAGYYFSWAKPYTHADGTYFSLA